MVAKGRKSIAKKTRFEVFKRDSFTCQYCGSSAPKVVLELDHIDPVARGGINNVMNYVTSCFDCNRGKSDRKLDDDAVITKQLAQLAEVQERRNQLKMLKEWKDECLSEESELCGLIDDQLSHLFDRRLSDSGSAIIMKAIRKFGINEILECLDIAVGAYKDCDTVVNKIVGIAEARKIERENPEKAKAIHIRNVLRKRFGHLNERYFWSQMNLAMSNNIDLDIAMENARACNSPGSFNSGIENFNWRCANGKD